MPWEKDDWAAEGAELSNPVQPIERARLLLRAAAAVFAMYVLPQADDCVEVLSVWARPLKVASFILK